MPTSYRFYIDQDKRKRKEIVAGALVKLKSEIDFYQHPLYSEVSENLIAENNKKKGQASG